MILLVIDIQKGITDSELYNFDTFIDRTVRLIDLARKNQVEVIYFQHDDGPGSGFSAGDSDFDIAVIAGTVQEVRTLLRSLVQYHLYLDLGENETLKKHLEKEGVSL